MNPEKGEKSVRRRLKYFKLAPRYPIIAIQDPILAVRGKLLHLRQLKDLMGMLDEVSSCWGAVGAETCDILKGSEEYVRARVEKTF